MKIIICGYSGKMGQAVMRAAKNDSECEVVAGVDINFSEKSELPVYKNINEVKNVVDDISNKVDSLNGLFSIIDFTTDKLAMISEKVTNGITLFIDKIFKKGKVDDEDE